MMKNTKTFVLPMMATAVLSGCIATGGGSFEPENVSAANFELAYQKKFGPQYITEANGTPLKTPDATDLSELGWDVSTPYGPHDETLYDQDFSPIAPKIKTIALSSARTALSNALYDWQQFRPDFQTDTPTEMHLENVKITGSDTQAQLGTGTWQYKNWRIQTTAYPLSSDKKTITFYGRSRESGKDIYFKITDYDSTVKAGFLEILDKDTALTLPREQIYQNLFYRIHERTQDMPIEGTATYTGAWEYATITPTSYGDTQVDSGSQVGGSLNPNTATFTVNFKEKNLTGSLSSTNSNSKKFGWDITATINLNGFLGSATKTSESDLPNNASISQTAHVSGAFAGKTASHLAGRLWAEDNTVAAVFAAKQTTQENIKTDGDLFNSYALRFEKDSEQADKTLFHSKDVEKQNFSGDINKFQIDNVLITLDSSKEDICCDSLQFLRFGTENHTSNVPNDSGQFTQNQEGSLLVQGYLTPHSDMPTTGSVSYQGYWTGFGKGDRTVSIRKGEASFSADFASKTVSGSLKNTGGTDAVKFDNLTITDNGFTGNATLSIHDGNSTGSGTAISGSATVTGNFYGTAANEIGGVVSTDDKNFGAVFGGKQVKTQ